MKLMGLKNIKVEHHRNGISGEGFHVCTFNYSKLFMLGVLFEEPGCCAVFDINLLSSGVIEFSKNSWRGDNFEPALRTAIQKWTDDYMKEYELVGWEG
jgi:hypothetical protein